MLDSTTLGRGVGPDQVTKMTKGLAEKPVHFWLRMAILKRKTAFQKIAWSDPRKPNESKSNYNIPN
jgi:hypothetical protein